MKEMYCGQLGIDEAVYNYGNNVLENLKERFEAIDEVAEYNQLKVIAAMQKNSGNAASDDNSPFNDFLGVFHITVYGI